MNKLISGLAITVVLFLLSSCAGDVASSARSRVEKVLTQSGCNYKIGEIKVENQVVDAAHKAEGITSIQWVLIPLEIETKSDRKPLGAIYIVVNGDFDHPQSSFPVGIASLHCTN